MKANRKYLVILIIYTLIAPILVYGVSSLNKVQNIDTFSKIQGVNTSSIRFVNRLNVTEPNVTASFTPLATTAINVAGFGAGWNDVNVTNLHSVPRGAIVQISAGNGRNAAPAIIGVRTDGSTLTRKINLDQAETDGYNFATFRTTVDATTGYVECFDDAVDADYVYYITGYWEGIDFAERWTEFTATADNVWGEHVIDAAQTGRVVSILMVNYDTINANMGIRHTASSIERKLNIDRGGGTHNTSLSLCVKLDGDGEVDLFSQDADKTFFMVEGFFGGNMDYTSQKTQWNVGGASTWEETNISSVLSGSPRVVEYIVSHNDQDTATLVGGRTNGSALDRRVDVHPSSGQWIGITLDVETSANNFVELYNENASKDRMYSIGYFIPSIATQTTQNVTLSALALHTNGTQIYDGNGDPFRILAIDVANDRWKLDGTSTTTSTNPTDNPYSCWWNPDDMAVVAGLGFNTVDLTLIWVSRASNGGGTVNEGFFANSIDAWVEWNTDAGLYSIIGFQRLSGPSGSTATYYAPSWLWSDYGPRNNFVDIAETICDFYDTTVASMDVERQYYIDFIVYCANRYKDNPYVMIAPSNEPMHGMKNEAAATGQQETATEGYRLFHEDMVDQMRATGYTGLILIDRNYVKGGFPGDFADGNYKVRKDNIVWESHSYVSGGTTPAEWKSNIYEGKAFAEDILGQPYYQGEWWIDPVAMKDTYDLATTTQNQWNTLENATYRFDHHLFHSYGRLYGEANYDAIGSADHLDAAEIAIVEGVIDRTP